MNTDEIQLDLLSIRIHYQGKGMFFVSERSSEGGVRTPLPRGQQSEATLREVLRDRRIPESAIEDAILEAQRSRLTFLHI